MFSIQSAICQPPLSKRDWSGSLYTSLEISSDKDKDENNIRLSTIKFHEISTLSESL